MESSLEVYLFFDVSTSLSQIQSVQLQPNLGLSSHHNFDIRREEDVGRVQIDVQVLDHRRCGTRSRRHVRVSRLKKASHRQAHSPARILAKSSHAVLGFSAGGRAL